MFRDAGTPPRDKTERVITLAEMDGTFLRTQREERDKFETRLGILTAGKELESPPKKTPRCSLLERILYGGVETAQVFGERHFLKGEAQLGTSHARELLPVGNGAELIKALAGHHRWRATCQLNSWHLTQGFQHCLPDHPHLVGTFKKLFFTGRAHEIIPAVRLGQLKHVGEPESVDKLLSSLRRKWDTHLLSPV